MKKSLIKRMKALRQYFVSCSAIRLTEHERIAVINALYRRAYDLSTDFIDGDKHIRETCKRLATEMMCRYDA